MIYIDASNLGYETVLMQNDKFIMYVSPHLKVDEKSYPTHDPELGEIVFCFEDMEALSVWI